ncbi:putative lipoprotein [Yersinia ruckeri]|nr:putative lipoprotein [Yersinia ruckeri]
MRVILSLSFLLISGCTLPLPQLTDQQITAFSSDDLCTALGSYNDHSKTVLRLTNEVTRRGASIDQERCYRISHIAMESNEEPSFVPHTDCSPATSPMPRPLKKMKVNGQWIDIPQQPDFIPGCSFGVKHQY